MLLSWSYLTYPREDFTQMPCVGDSLTPIDPQMLMKTICLRGTLGGAAEEGAKADVVEDEVVDEAADLAFDKSSRSCCHEFHFCKL